MPDDIEQSFKILQCIYWNQGQPDNENQSDGRTERIDSNISNLANQMSYFQMEPIKCSVQINEISTCLLWCLRDYTVVYQ